MSHQPFENWILDGETLSLSDRRALQAHLDRCQSCARLQENWQALYVQMRVKPLLTPAQGFTQRWQAGLAARRAQAQRRQAWKIFAAFLATALLIGMVLTGYLITTSSPSDWIEAVAQLIGSLAGMIGFGSNILRSWLQAAPFGLTIALWMYLTICFCLISLVWITVVWRTHVLGVFNR